MSMRLSLAAVCLCVIASSAAAQQTISADVYADKLRGMWMGEILGNYAGRPREGYVAYGGLNYTVNWDTVRAANTLPLYAGYPSTYWDGDDDTGLEFLNLSLLNSQPDPTAAQAGQNWKDHIAQPAFYIANRQARWLLDKNYVTPQTGSQRYNLHWAAIDSQITTESIGALSPGQRQRAADLTGRFASITNDGFAVHAAQFYAAMYSVAPFETDVQTVVAKGLAVVPTTSRTHQAIQDVLNWYAANPTDWTATQRKIYDRYAGSQSNGRYDNWIESTTNVAMTTMALLYGGGDFRQTVEIGVNGGFDADCNPATAGGIIGLMKGYSGLPTDITTGLTDNYVVSARDPTWITNINRITTVTNVVSSLQSAAEAQILRSGGTITGAGSQREYHIASADTIAPLAEKPDPTGPKGLVKAVLDLGGHVTPAASRTFNDAPSDYPNDRHNLASLIDGITDVSYNGHVAYSTEGGTPAAGPAGDWYRLMFDRKVNFNKVVFYEGDFRQGSASTGGTNINAFPDSYTPAGGYFDNLIVEVLNDGVWSPVTNLQFPGEQLDPYSFYQTIEMTFDPVQGQAIGIRGAAGGTVGFTTILELEAYGEVPEPATAALLLAGAAAMLRRRRVCK